MNRSKKIILIIISLLTISCFASITLESDKRSVRIGERIDFKIQLSYPEKAIVDYGSLEKDSIAGFEKLEQKLIEKKNEKGIVNETIRMVYTTFADSGKHVFGPLKLKYMLNQEEYEQESESIEIYVNSLLSHGSVSYIDSTGQQKELPLDSLQSVLPLKTVKEYLLTDKEKLFLTWLVVGILFVTIVVYIMLRKKKNGSKVVKIIPKVIIPADVIALEKLAELKKKDYLKRGEHDLFATEISYITREYMENRYEFAAVELPTCDVKTEAQKYITDRTILEDLEKLLEITDFVKFARYIPLEDEMKPFIDIAEKFFGTTKKVPKPLKK